MHTSALFFGRPVAVYFAPVEAGEAVQQFGSLAGEAGEARISKKQKRQAKESCFLWRNRVGPVQLDGTHWQVKK